MAIVDVLSPPRKNSGLTEPLDLEGATLANQISTVRHVTITLVFLFSCLLSSIFVEYYDIQLSFTVSIIGATVLNCYHSASAFTELCFWRRW